MEKLSAVIIAKNESAMLSYCLESIKWVDEIVVCDTGSQDNTVEIAKKYTDNVQFFEWCDDFSKARNYAKSFATHNWILSIDCDEIVVTENWIKKIKELINTVWDDVDSINVIMWNWADTRNNSLRVFRKKLDWKWAIHEAVYWKKQITSDVEIKYWRSPAHNLDPDLDLRILEKEHAIDPDNSRVMFYLWREYIYYWKYIKAIEVLEKYLTKTFFLSEKCYAYFLLAQCYFKTNQWDLARDRCMEAIKMNPNFKRALLLMSDMYYEPNKSRWKSFAELADNSWCLFKG